MLGLLGGSFDPIHNGHLHIAKSLYEQLPLKEIRFVPCKNPILWKKVIANETQRLAMLERALAPYPYYLIDERELKRTTPAYTLETLISLRQEFPNIPIALILGSDNLENLNSWYKWTSLIEYAHLVIVPRTDYPKVYNESIQTFIKKFQIENPSLLSEQAAGLLLMTHVKPLAISATAIRTEIARGLQPIGLLPSSVLAYIYEQKLYL
ncbi:MAG: nicotinate-nucleotide adenylyltransferase [Rickettsiella sp.]|nr:nicotinate-nucleotide adenylyltransferase [Rickettsiella sp.]